MHNIVKFYYFIDNFDSKEIKSLDPKISLIFRNHKSIIKSRDIKEIKKICFIQNRKFYLANNLKLALKFKLDGVYIPSFNKLLNFKNINMKKGFKVLGSAHNLAQIKNKELQGCDEIFIAPIFKTTKSSNYLDIMRFNLLSHFTFKKIIALGGINKKNFPKIKMTKALGVASISWIKKNRPIKIGRFK